MLSRPRPSLLCLTGLLGLAAPAFAVAGQKPTSAVPVYEQRVLPLFQDRCGACHGAGQTRAGLDVRTAGDLLQGGSSGPAVKPGSPEGSLLYQMLVDGRMPKGGRRFTPAELKWVADWIRSGARGTTQAGHWAFRSPRAVPVPKLPPGVTARNPVDAFLLTELRRKGLSFSPEADRRTLIRRVTYDLIGLPPTPEEGDAFLADKSPDAYEKVVDRLLASPHYGERWARYWLDPAGYADSEGVLQEDRVRPNMWRYRDYVIRSFNADKPYDQFLREQLAGDELVDYRHAERFTPEIIEKLTATGFLRTAVDATRDDFNAHQYGEYQYRMLHDVQTIVFSTTLGLTVQCARCHDHKYEPISQKDYYRVQALFMGGVRPRGAVLPTNRRQIVAGGTAEQKEAAARNAQVDAAVAEIAKGEAVLLAEYRPRALREGKLKVPEADRAPLAVALALEDAKRTPEQKALVAKHKAAYELPGAQLAGMYAELKTPWGALQARRVEEGKKRVVLPEIRAFYDLDASPPPTPLLVRGEWLHPGDPVAPGIPAILDDPRRPFAIPSPAPGQGTTGRRKAFAEWLTRPDHPLTSRVIVNRVWAHHFGVGLVPTTENFGRAGARPSNPELLDFLATCFTASPADGETEGKSDGEIGGKREGENEGKSDGEKGTASASSRSRRPTLSPSPHLGWSLKKLHRLLVTSAAYRQSSAWRSAAKLDPEDRLLWRQRPRRLEAEAVRDGILAVSGSLDGTLYGEPVPLETRPTGETVPAGESGTGRRSIYLLVRRTAPVNLLNAFDAPVMETNCTRRIVSTTPTQALAVMNSGFVAAQAERFAHRVLGEGHASRGPDTIQKAFLLAFGRPPKAAELVDAQRFLQAQEERYRNGAKGQPDEAARKAFSDFCQALLSANEFVYVD